MPATTQFAPATAAAGTSAITTRVGDMRL
jgi:hypothetical protein